MRLRTFLKPLSFVPALVLMYVIFCFSAQEGEESAALSYKVSYYMVQTADQVLDTNLEEWEVASLANRFHGVTRKLAHMTEYFALAIAVSFPLYVYGLHGIPLMLVAGMICVAFACGDEYHQSFVAGRGPSKRDVFIDSFGVFWGIILVRIIGWTGRKTIFRPLRRKKRQTASPADYPDEEYFQGVSPYYGVYPANGIPADGIAPSVYPPPADRNYKKERVSSYYNSTSAQRQSGPYPGRQSGRPDYRGPVPGPRPYPQQFRQGAEDDRGTDHLSEDLSLKKLVHDIRDQRQQEKKKS